MTNETESKLRDAHERCVESWRILETYRALHLFGRFRSEGAYWATPPILRLDAARQEVVTVDRAVYRLLGRPGTGDNAASFIVLCSAFDERLLETRDVTSEYFDELESLGKVGVVAAGRHLVAANCKDALRSCVVDLRSSRGVLHKR